MTKKKKKELTVVLSLLVVMIIVIVAYVLVSKSNAKKDADASAEVNLLTLDSSLATEVSLSNSNGDMTFVNTDGTWTLDGDDSFEVDEDTLDTLLDEFTSIDATKQIVDNQDNVTDYGLDEPSCVATITLSDGTVATISLGSEVPVAGGYYGILDGTDGIYAFSSDKFTTFFNAQSDFEAAAATEDAEATEETEETESTES